MQFNKSQRAGLARVCNNLAVGLAAISIIGSFVFGISILAAAVLLTLSTLLVVFALVIQGLKASDED